MPTIEIPEKKDAKVVAVTLKCSTGRGDDKNEQDFEASMPATLADAIALEGPKAVFARYLKHMAIELQAAERQKLAPAGEKKERKRANYLEQLGL